MCAHICAYPHRTDARFAGVSLHEHGAGWPLAAGETETGRPAEDALLVVAGWLSEFRFPSLCGTEQPCIFIASLPPTTAGTLGSIADRPHHGADRLAVWLTQNCAGLRVVRAAAGHGSVPCLPTWDGRPPPPGRMFFLDASSACTVLAWERACSRCVTAGKPRWQL